MDINKIIDRMTNEEKVGQLFLAHCPLEGAEELVERLKLGGLLLFARNFESEDKDSIREKINLYNSRASIPLLIAADEEGGTVVRISKFPQYRPEPFKSPKDIYACGGFDAVREESIEKARLLLSLGVNYNLAPVCDYTADEDKYIARRSFGRSPEECAEFIDTAVSAMVSEGLCVSLKHFPGYGGNADTHKGMAHDGRDISEFEGCDLIPFAHGIAAGAQSVMVAHNIVACFDGEYPASLSYPVHEYLRKEMNFDKVIITDSLTMAAIRDFTGGEDPCVRALNCGNDMIITSHFENGISAVLEALKTGEVSEKRLNEALYRVLTMKSELGLLTTVPDYDIL